MISRKAFCGNSGAARDGGGGLSGLSGVARRIGVIAAATKEFSLSA